VRVAAAAAAAAALATAVVGCGGASAVREVCGRWNVSHTSAHLQFLSVVSPSDVWASGGGVIQHWDGHGWEDAGAPASAGEAGIAALGRDNVWAASPGEAITHWNGKSWQTSDVGPGGISGTNNDYTLFARGPSDAWVTWRQDIPSGGVGYGGIEHWNGRRWSRFPQTGLTGVMDQAHDWLATSADGDIWAASSWVERWDGRQWQIVPVPNLSRQYLFDSLAPVNHADAWLAGASPGAQPGQPLDSVIEHWDGKTWTVTPTGFPSSGEFIEQLKDIAASAARAWAVGEYAKSFDSDKQPLLLSWDGRRWRRDDISSWGGKSVEAVAALQTGDVWIVGDGVRAHFKPCERAA
jgi:hypothetical protein